MNRLILGSLSVLLLSTATTPTIKPGVAATPITQATMAIERVPEHVATRMAVTPFNLVFLAFHGFFEQEGIPSSMTLVSAYVKGKVTAKDLVKIAISMNRLPSNTLDDQNFINQVDTQLKSLASDG
ncbi:MAG TPA: hypothetical protein V6D11_01380 [Waterburya sp.]|jgi:hypothetical protein